MKIIRPMDFDHIIPDTDQNTTMTIIYLILRASNLEDGNKRDRHRAMTRRLRENGRIFIRRFRVIIIIKL